MLLSLLFAVASAQSTPKLVDGTPEFEGCFSSATCADNFYRFLGLSMAEQGFTFQNDPQLLSPTLSRREGWSAGALLSTFPFAKPRENLSGKAENTSYSPVLPRLFGGWRGQGPGETSRAGAGVFFLPPVPVGGASALVAGVEGGLSWGLGQRGRVGVEVDFTYTRARAPIVASEEQYNNRESFDNPANLDPATYQAVCVPAGGCVDTFTLANGGLRAAASVDVGVLSPYLKLGINPVAERLWVMYDDTTWAMRGVQPVAHAGSLLFLGDHVDLSLGTALALRGANLSTADEPKAGLFYGFQGAAGWSF